MMVVIEHLMGVEISSSTGISISKVKKLIHFERDKNNLKKDYEK